MGFGTPEEATELDQVSWSLHTRGHSESRSCGSAFCRKLDQVRGRRRREAGMMSTFTKNRLSL